MLKRNGTVSDIGSGYQYFLFLHKAEKSEHFAVKFRLTTHFTVPEIMLIYNALTSNHTLETQKILRV